MPTIRTISIYVEEDVVIETDVRRYVKSYFVTMPYIETIHVHVADEIHTYDRSMFDI